MEAASRSRWDTLFRRTRTLLVIVIGLAVLQQMCGPLRLEAARNDLLDRLQQQRKSRVIAMIHRQDTVSLFGVPVTSSIGIEDSEAILRAIRLTSFCTRQAASCWRPSRSRSHCWSGPAR
jgi:hypothetical protein